MSTYSSNLKIELIGTGEQVGTWGTTTNSNFSNVFEASIVGRVTVNFATDANKTLSASDSVSAQDFRNVYLNLTSSGSLTATRDLIVPTINKNYIVQNNTTGGQSIRVITAAGTGITIPNGATSTVYADGTNVIAAFSHIGGDLTVASNLSVGGTLTLTGGLVLNGNVTVGDSAADTLTINSTITSNMIFTDNTYDIGASGATRPRTGYFGTAVYAPLLDATNLEVTNIKAIDSTASMAIASSTGIVTFTANPVLSGGTANGVLYLNGSKSVTSGTAFVFDGTNLGLGSSSLTGINLRISSTSTGATSTYGVYLDSAIQSGVTSSYNGYYSVPSTAAAAFTLTSLVHYGAYQGTLGAGSAVTNQYGYFVDSTLTGATNNYGFYSNIATGSNRYNFYAAGSANNYFGGPTVIEVSSSSDALRITQTGAGNAILVEDSSNPDSTPFVVTSDGTVSVGATSNPASKFGVTTSSAGATDLYRTGAAGEVRLTFYNDNASSTAVNASRISGLLTTTTAGSEAGALLFSTTSAGTIAEKMRLDSSGNLGVGRTTISGFPSGSVDSNGALAVRSSLSGGQTDAGILQYGSNVTSILSYGNTVGSGIVAFRTGGGGGSGTTERMRIDSSGFVGIGTSSPVTKLDIKAIYGYGASYNGAIRIENYNTTTASFIDVVSSLNLFNNSQYYGGGLRIAEDTTASGISLGGGAVAFFTNSGLTAATTYTPTERMRLDTSGNLGLGVTPSAWGSAWRSLDVGVSTSIVSYLTTTPNSSIIANNYYHNGTNYIYKNTGYASSYSQGSGAHSWATAPSGTAGNAITFTQAMTLDASGRLLVGATSARTFSGGTSTPHLQIEGIINNAARVSIVDNSATNDGGLIFGRSKGSTLGSVTAVASGDALGFISFQGADGTNLVQAASIGAEVDGTPGTNDMPGRLLFKTSADGSATPTERMRIDSSGNVLIGGTAVGDGKLQVQDTGTYTACVWNPTSVAANVGSTMLFSGSTGANRLAMIGGYFSGAATTDGGYMAFSTRTVTSGALTEKMRLDASGNLGLGVTPSAWSGYVGLQVGSRSSLAGNSTFMTLSQNYFNDGADKYIGTGNATQYYQGNGAHVWRTAPSGTAGNAITFTQAMTLDSAGKLLLGATSTRSGLAYMQTTEGGNTAGNITVRNTADTGGAVSILAKSRGTTAGSVTSVIANDTLGFLSFYGADGTSLVQGAWIAASVDGTPGTNDMPGRLVFATTSDGASSPTERARITSDGYLRLAGSGIQLNGDTAAANALNDYEEGTYTPVISGATTAGTGTYSVQVGRYTKIGNIVTVAGRVIWSAHTGTGIMRLSLPFTVKNIANYYPPGSMDYSNFTVGTGKQGVTAVNYNTTYGTFDACDPAGGARANISIDTAADIMFSFTYEV